MPRKPEQLSNVVRSLTDYYRAMFDKMLRADALYQQDFSKLMNFDYEVPVYQSSKGTTMVDGFRNQIRTDEPTVVFTPTSTSREAQSHAYLMQQWGYGQLVKERERIVADPNVQCAFNLLLRGAACKRILVDVDSVFTPPAAKHGSKEYREWESALAASWPYSVKALDPLTVLPCPGSKRPLPYIIEVQKRWVGDLWEQFPSWSDPMGSKAKPSEQNNPARMADWIEYWSGPTYKRGSLTHPGWYIVEVDGERVIEQENPYLLVPYVYEWSGLGHVHSDADPAHLAVGVLSMSDGAIEAYVRIMTALSVQTMIHVFPTILTTQDAQKTAKQFAIGPGRVIQHPPGQPPTYMQPMPPNENFYRLLDRIEAEIGHLTSEALAGIRPTGVSYGVHQAQLLGQALKIIGPIRATLDRIGSQTLNMMAQLAHVMNLSMTVGGSAEKGERPKLLTGDDFRHYNFSVAFEAVDPAENDRMLLVGEAMRRANDLSRRTFWKVYAKHVVPNADDEEAELLAEQLMTQLVQSGQLMGIVLSEDAAAQAGTEAESVGEKLPVVQRRQNETVPQTTGARARELENIAGSPGSLGIPMEIAEEGMRESARGR